MSEEQRSITGNRRRVGRIEIPFHAKVRGVDCTGRPFNIETVLDNIGRDGLYMRMMPDVEMGAHLAIDVGLYTASHVTDDGPRFSVDGVVVRKDMKAGGAAGVAVFFVSVDFP